jgi:hypothetical protein
MKLWRYMYHDDDSGSGTVQQWFTSERAAKAKRAEIERDKPQAYSDYGIKPITVPTKKVELCEFLNTHCDTA